MRTRVAGAAWGLLLLAASAAVAGCAREAPSRFDERPVAEVDGDPITVSWFERSYVDFLIRSGANDTRETRYAHLDNLVDAVLLAQEARRRGMDRTEEFAEYSQREREKAVGGRFFTEAFTATLPPPSDEELRETFRRWKSERVVRHLFFRNPDSAAAAYERLRAGSDFLEEARRTYGLAEVDSAAGMLGAVRYFNLDDAFAEAAFDLEPGAFSEPVRSRVGWHIVRVERTVENPLLTEEEYQTRRSGLSSQFRLRRRRVEGDRFVRSFMESLNVRVEPAAIRALADVIDEMTYEERPDPEIVDAGRSEAIAMRMEPVINPETVLATFEWRGESRAFTAADYVHWLPDLPYQEAWQRTAASVGRALRNEAFALEGEERGLYDRTAQRIVRESETLRLSSLLRRELAALDLEPDSLLIERAIDQRHLRVANAQLIRYGEIPFERYEDARAAAVAAPDRSAFTWKSVESGFDLPAWATVLGRLPLGVPTVVNRGLDDWAVILVSERTPVATDDSTSRAIAREAVRPLMGVYTELRDLRDQTPVRVDSVLFETIMRFGDGGLPAP